MPTLPVGQLQSLITAIFERAGAPPPHARIVADHLLEANLLGHDSHGVMRVPQYCNAILESELMPAAQPRLVRESLAGAVFDGCRSFGQVAASEAMNTAIGKARRAAVGAVTVRNCYHSGRLAAYTQQAAAVGMIGIVMVNAGGGGQSVVPFGGRERRIATNPFSIAAPSEGEFPIVLDVATSMAPEGKVRDHHQRGAKLPDGWIVDAHGRPSNDPSDFYGPPAGAILPLGGTAGYKGFGMALMIDILAGALSGAGCCRAETVPARDGILLMAIDVQQFVDPEAYFEQVAELVAHIKSCPPAPGFEEIFVPGEIEFREAQRRRSSGVAICAQVWNDLQAIADRLNVLRPRDSGSNGAPPKRHAFSGDAVPSDLAAS